MKRCATVSFSVLLLLLTGLALPATPESPQPPVLAAQVDASSQALVPAAGKKSAAATTGEQLLQFTSAGHVLGFDSHGVIIAAGDHMLKVEFAGAEKTAPEVKDSNTAGNGVSSPLTRVTYHNLWKGVTVVYEAVTGAIFRSSYYLEPEGDSVPVDRICLRYNRPVRLDENGNLVISYETGNMVESAPVAWQEVDGNRVAVAVAFKLKGEKEVGFKLGDHIAGMPVKIDPHLVWNTFLGGSGWDEGGAVATDGTCVYVAGSSSATWGSPVRGYTAFKDAFAAKLNKDGNLIWHTFLGGNKNDSGDAIATDGSGSVYVTGSSNDGWGSPLRPHSGTGNWDAFVAKLDGSGTLLWNTFLGGSGSDSGSAIAAQESYACVAGSSTATWGSPVRSHDPGTNLDAFVAKVGKDGSLKWNTFLGGSGDDQGRAIATDGSNVYVAGYSYTTWQGIEPPVRPHDPGANYDAFAARLDGSGSLTWNTFLGGSGWDEGGAVATDGTCVYVAGSSSATWGSPVRGYTALGDAFAAKLDKYGNLEWNTFLGGSGWDEGRAIATDGSNVYVAGYSDDTWGTSIRGYTRLADAFAAKLDGSGTLLWNTFLGGYGSDWGLAIATESSYVYVAGESDATWENPVLPYQGYRDAFVAKLGTTGPPAVTTKWPTAVGEDSATLNMDYTLGDYSSVDVCFAYKKSSDSTWFYTSWVTKSASGTHSETLTGLTPGTQYDFKAQLKYDSTTIEGSTLQFFVGEPPDVPDLKGKSFYTKCSIKLYDWRCNKDIIITGGTLYITDQYGHKITGYWQPDVVPQGWPPLEPLDFNGYVGSFHRVDGKVKNTPRISLILEAGNYCQYPSGSYVTYVLNGKIKWDKKADDVKSIKGTIYGWGEYGMEDTDEPGKPSRGQFEGKFTATLMDGAIMPQAASAPAATPAAEVSPTQTVAIEVPNIKGDYPVTCSIKFFDWECNKYDPVTGGTLHITTQGGHKIEGYWEPDVIPQGWPTLVPVKGYVGPLVKIDGKVKNTPRLSLVLEAGTYCQYPSGSYVTYVLNAKVKWDKKADTVKSIKGTIYGWGEWGDNPDEPGYPKFGQFEGKFTAIPPSP